MKKFYLTLLIFLFIPLIAFAQSRQEMAVELADIFSLKGENSGLYYYNDWQKIEPKNRAAVSQCALTGLFAPERGEFMPSAAAGIAEKNIAASGLDKFVFLSNKYDKAMGIVESGGRIAMDGGGELTVDRRTAFLGNRGIESCESLKTGQKVNLCIDSAGKVYIVWEQKSGGGALESYEVVSVRQGELYLWDLYEREFIFKWPRRLKFGDLTPASERYDNFYVHEDAKIYLGRDLIPRADINKKWLDRRANYVVGKDANGSWRILHLEFE